MTTITIDRATVEQALEALESVLCDPEGKCCIDGSDADRAVVDKALAAFRAALAQQAEPVPAWKPWKPVEWGRGCQACGIGADGRAYGYVCPRSDCPTKVTCGGVA